MNKKRITTILVSLSMLFSLNGIEGNVIAEDNFEELRLEDNILSCEYYDFDVEWSQNGRNVSITLQNTNDTKELINWSIVYTCDAKIENTLDVDVINGEMVHYLSSKEHNDLILPNESVMINLELDNDDVIEMPNDFSVYYYYDSEDEEYSDELYNECTDSITISCVDGSVSYNDADENCDADDSDNEDEISDEELIQPCDNSRKINYVDNRTLITNTSVEPYSRIALLEIEYPNGLRGFATGFMISEEYLATSAHNLYDVETEQYANLVRAYFGRNGSVSLTTSTVLDYSICVNYPQAQNVGSDWAVCKLAINVGEMVGWFNVDSSSDDTLANCSVSVTGYPGDKFVKNENTHLGYNTYMYTASSRVNSVSDYSFRYSADTFNGNSGSPVYRGTLDVVYGIHSGGVVGENLNHAKRITQAVRDTWEENGWIS